MSVLDESALAGSPLADLHAIATELGIDGFRRLRKEELVEAILGHQGADTSASRSSRAPRTKATPEPGPDTEVKASTARRRGGRSRRREPAAEAGAESEVAAKESTPRPTRTASRDAAPERAVEGTIELLANGSAFVRTSPPEPSDEDAYLSAAQVRRCELVSGDIVTGPVRPPRRSERHPALVRIDTINGRPADEVAEGTHFDELPAAFPTERLQFDNSDATLRAIEWLTPIGKGSRATICGGSRAGKSEVLLRLAGALSAREDVELSIALLGVRPEELGEWNGRGVTATVALSFVAALDARAHALTRCLDAGRRVAARGGDAVVLIDSLDGLSPGVARKAMASARKIVDGGSLTVVATASAPLGGETTTIALDAALAAEGRYPAFDLAASGTLHAERLVGEDGSAAIAKARREAREAAEAR